MNKIINNHTVKGLQEFLNEDKSLTECMAYEEFESKKAAPNNSRIQLKDLAACKLQIYNEYRKLNSQYKNQIFAGICIQ